MNIEPALFSKGRADGPPEPHAGGVAVRAGQQRARGQLGWLGR